MTPAEAAWVREHVWTHAMRKVYREVPGLYTVCACQYGPTSWCQTGRHGRCHRATPQPGPAGYVCGRGGDVPLYFTEPYEHPTPSATGHHRTADAMFWYADRVCRWVCPCRCHTGGPVEMTAPAHDDDGALFDLEVL